MCDIKDIEAVKNVIKKSLESLNKNKLPNPFYGKEVLFFEGCVEPKVNRSQLMGYLGMFSGGNKELSTNIDYAIVPNSSYRKLLKGDEIDDIIKKIKEKVHVKNKSSGKYRNTLPNTKFIPEKVFLEKVFIFSENDPVKMDQFKKLEYNFELKI